MIVSELLRDAYAECVSGADGILLAAATIPLAGGVLARVGKAGSTDADGRIIASVVVGLGLLAVALEVAAIAIAHALLGASALDADSRLLVAPPICLVGCLAAIRLVFPLSELGSVRTFLDLVWFGAACAGALWFFSMFRGWGIYFVGSFLQLVVVLVLGGFLLRRLYRRAFGPGRTGPLGLDRERS